MSSRASGSKLIAGFRWLDRVVGKGLLEGGSRLMAAGAALCVVLLGLLTVAEVAGRKSPLAGAWLSYNFEVGQFLMAMATVFALSYCWMEGGHIRMGLLREKGRPRLKATVDGVASLFGVLYAAAVIWGVWSITVDNLAFNAKTPISRLPLAPFQIVFMVMMAHFGLIMLRSCLVSLISLRWEAPKSHLTGPACHDPGDAT